MTWNSHWRYRWPILAAVLGGFAGYAYYAVIGCATGSCPLTSTPYVPTFLGAVLGANIAWPTKEADTPEHPEPDPGAAGSGEVH